MRRSRTARRACPSRPGPARLRPLRHGGRRRLTLSLSYSLSLSDTHLITKTWIYTGASTTDAHGDAVQEFTIIIFGLKRIMPVPAPWSHFLFSASPRCERNRPL